MHNVFVIIIVIIYVIVDFTIIITEPYDVLILTYMRSGSTFIGKLLGGRLDTFYWYEPFWKTHLWEYVNAGGKSCLYGRPFCSQVYVQISFYFHLLCIPQS